MADATCRSYASAINNCESFAKEHHFPSWRLYTEDRKVAEETIKLLMADENFQEYNANQHNRFRAALQKYLAFIGSPNITFGSASPKNKVEESTPYRNEAYEAVLSQYFKKGFRICGRKPFFCIVLLLNQGAVRLLERPRACLFITQNCIGKILRLSPVTLPFQVFHKRKGCAATKSCAPFYSFSCNDYGFGESFRPPPHPVCPQS